MRSTVHDAQDVELCFCRIYGKRKCNPAGAIIRDATWTPRKLPRQFPRLRCLDWGRAVPRESCSPFRCAAWCSRNVGTAQILLLSELFRTIVYAINGLCGKKRGPQKPVHVPVFVYGPRFLPRSIHGSWASKRCPASLRRERREALRRERGDREGPPRMQRAPGMDAQSMLPKTISFAQIQPKLDNQKRTATVLKLLFCYNIGQKFAMFF